MHSRSEMDSSGISVRSLLIGLGMVIFLSAITPYVEMVIAGTQIGSICPPAGAFFLLVCLALGANPLVRYLSRQKRYGLRQRELITIYCLLICTATISSVQFVQFLVPMVTGAFYYATAENGWAETIQPLIPDWFSPRSPEAIRTLGSGDLFGFIPLPVVLMLFMWVVTIVILRGTYPGRCMYAIGGNEEASRLSGINVFNQKLFIYTLSGFFAAVAGILFTARLASAQPQAGFTFELDAIAAVVIGGASLSGGVGGASGTLIGALILGVLRNGLNLLNVSPFWQQVVIGAVIALAVMTDTLRRRKG